VRVATMESQAATGHNTGGGGQCVNTGWAIIRIRALWRRSKGALQLPINRYE